MAIVDIAPQATSWPNPDQYIQDVIDANPAGTQYRLQSGVHRMQTMELEQGDIMEMQVGAILRGSQDASEANGVTWTADGGNWWASFSDFTTVNGVMSSGYVNWREWPIVDGKPLPFIDDLTNIDPTTCFYDDGANRLYINLDPTGADIEIARQRLCIQAADLSATDCQFYGNYGANSIIENYAAGAQSENAGVKIGRNGQDTVPDANWVCHDLVFRGFRGMALAHGDGCVIERVVGYNHGQMGVGGSSTHDGKMFTSIWTICGIGGFSAGWEAGNTKWAHTDNQIVAGCWFDSVGLSGELNPNTEIIGPLWFDIENDGSLIYSNVVADGGAASLRGLFWEICWSAKVYKNIMHNLSYNSENGFWACSFMASTSGATATSIFPFLEIFNNWSYYCAGGIKGIQADRGSGDQGDYKTDKMRVFGNMTVMSDDLDWNNGTWRGVTGTDGQSTTGVTWGSDILYDENIYAVVNDTQSWWRADGRMEQGGGGSEGFIPWQGDGMDNDGVSVPLTDSPLSDFNPFNGGVL